MEEIVLTEEQRIKCDEDFARMNARFDEAEKAILDTVTPCEFPLKHTFTNGLYSRQIFMPAGALLTSKIHMTQHQFAVLTGVATVWDSHNGTQLIKAPYTGITEPATRRILFIHEDMIWITYHPTDKSTPEEVEEDIIWHRVNQLIAPKEEPICQC